MDIVTQSQLNTLRQALESRLSVLRSELSGARQARALAQAGQESSDTKDLAGRLQLDELDELHEQRALDELAASEAALARLAVGSYGQCVDCGAAIALPRLRLLPATLRCAACQHLHEHRSA
ncbi:TraR/DksA C4-type zinc finger protein [Paucibacter sp. O1-1]|nr:TraR/DksA C4-type zinc finger protein [Paucibacter sp. O1-1]MDA3827476.1 TraR/DksA C4-type zinc finger protein [Paucibacter sp. O1-1]